MRRRRTIFVNEAFRPQRVSGQQRYAREISDRLPADVVRVAPTGFWAGGKLRTWLWVQTVLPISTWRGVLVSMTARAPVWHPRHVLVVHDLFVIEHPEWFSSKYHLTHAPLQRFQMRTVKALAAVSRPVADEIVRSGVAETVAVAPNAPSPVFAAARPDDAERVSARGLTPGRYLVTVGSLEPRKNLQRLAEAYAELPADVRTAFPLVVVGAGGGVFADSTVDWPVGVQLAGYVDDDELRALYGASAAIVFVSLAEGFGLPLVEAVIAGAPALVVSDIPVFRWICSDGAIYVDPTDPAAIADSLRRVTMGTPLPAAPDVSRFTWSGSADIVASSARDLA